MGRVATVSGITGFGLAIAGVVVPMLIPSLPQLIEAALVGGAAALIIVPIVWLVLNQKGSAGGGDTHIHYHHYAQLADLAGIGTLPPAQNASVVAPLPTASLSPPDAVASVEPPPVQIRSANIETKPPEIGQAELKVIPAEFPPGLYVGTMIVSAGKLVDEHSLEIGIRAFNGTGRELLIHGIEGRIWAGKGGQNNIELPPVERLGEEAQQPIPAFREFGITLRQGLAPDVAERFLKAIEDDYVSMAFCKLNVEVQASDAPKAATRLPLWDGAHIRRRDDLFTGRVIMLSGHIGGGMKGPRPLR
jgi:hypothetical protein